jgi:hypothetical protein
MYFIHDNNYYFAEKYISLQMIRGIVRNSGKKRVLCMLFDNVMNKMTTRETQFIGTRHDDAMDNNGTIRISFLANNVSYLYKRVSVVSLSVI